MAMYCFICGRNSETERNLSFFRFPKDEGRSAVWLEAALDFTGRPHLPKYTPAYCHANLRVCAKHFEDGMFAGMARSRLNIDATPVLSSSRGLVHPLPPEGSRAIYEEVAQASSVHSPSPLPELQLHTAGAVLSEEGAPSQEHRQHSVSDKSCQTSTSLSAKSPRKTELRRKVQRLKRTSSRKLILEQQQPQKKITVEDVSKFFEEHYSSNIANFIKTQMALLPKNPKGVRYSSEYKQFALTIYFLGPKVYKFLAKTFRLPSKSTLLRITKKWPINSGVSQFLLSVLKSKADVMLDNARECLLCIDEMSLKSNLFYATSQDEIIGFHSINGKKEFKPGNNALVLMLRGIHSKWKQPIAYYFVNASCPVQDLKKVLIDCITKLFSINFSVVAVTSDQGSNFVKLTKELDISVQKPYFVVDNHKVYYIFDVPHLLKSTRNNFFKYEFQIGDSLTKKKYLVDFYVNDKRQSYRLAPKLTNQHMYPNPFQKMKVKYAAQVFSATVVAALNTYISFGKLPSDAAATADFIEKVDKLFDVLNSSTFKAAKSFNRAFMRTPVQLNFLEEMLVLFQNLIVRDTSGTNVTKQMKFLKGWQITISSVLNLSEELKERGIHTLMTRRLQQDCLENFFGSIRQQNGNCRNPTPVQFANTFKKMFCLNYFNQSEGTNCLEEFDSILAAITPDAIKKYSVIVEQPPEIQKLLVNTNDYTQLDFAEKNAFHYVGGYFLKKCLQQHTCETCEDYAKSETELTEGGIYSHFRAYENASKDTYGNLKMPQQDFFSYFGTLENIFQAHFPDCCIQPNVAVQLKETIASTAVLVHPCDNFPHDYLQKLFVRTRIFYTLKFLNRELLQPKSKKPTSKLKVVKHL